MDPIPAACVRCGKDAPHFANLDGRPQVPRRGDATRCSYCGCWTIRTRKGWRAATLDEIETISPGVREESTELLGKLQWLRAAPKGEA